MPAIHRKSLTSMLFIGHSFMPVSMKELTAPHSLAALCPISESR
jgi:hypothetical protein